MKGIIEYKTILIPYIICEGAVWEYLEEEYRQIAPVQCGEIVSLITDKLCDKADHFYSTNLQFRKGITSNENGRNKLWMWFKHWAAKEVKDYFKTNSEILETAF